MLFLLFLLVSNTFFSQAAILECDFETSCNDFSTDSNWGLTNGLNPQPIDHDHTLDNSSGHYIFYNPQDTGFQIAEIKTSDWLELSNNRTVCFRMWYYTPRINLPFYIQLIQGGDEQLIRVIDSIIGKDPSTNDWALVNITLPSEKFKIAIRLNTTGRPLAFDDISVDYCDESHPPPPSKVLYQCNFESSCSDDFVSLPAYPYQWSILKASDAIQIENQAPKTDYTFDNSSGHYAILPNLKQFARGKVGYLHLQSELNITSEESYCLNLYYYAFGRSYASDLNVYLQLSNESKIIQRIWPLRPGSYYTYNRNQWTWGIINLPIGEYTLLFRVDSTDVIPLSFALDNIAILSCAYPSTERSSYENLLSFSCTFDDLTMCNMINDADTSVSSRFNFTVFNGETLPDKELGPSRDHTTNSTTGGFLYWNRNLPFTAKDVGRVYQSTSIAQNLGMCVKFSYYVKSATVRKNGTQISLSAGGCYGASLWSRTLDDSEGWQTVIIPVLNLACAEKYYFDVYQTLPIAVSVAFDDIEIDQCTSLTPTTTSTITSTTTLSTSTSSSRTSVVSSSTTQSSSSISTKTTTTMTTVTTTTSILVSSTTTRVATTTNNAYRLLSSMNIYWMIIYFLYRLI